MDECHKRKTVRSEDEKKIITNRINRISGQLTAINKMVQNDKYCNDILIQLSAIENSVKSLSNHILENHIYSCVADDLEKGNMDVIDELIRLFKKFNRQEGKKLDMINIEHKENSDKEIYNIIDEEFEEFANKNGIKCNYMCS